MLGFIVISVFGFAAGTAVDFEVLMQLQAKMKPMSEANKKMVFKAIKEGKDLSEVGVKGAKDLPIWKGVVEDLGGKVYEAAGKVSLAF